METQRLLTLIVIAALLTGLVGSLAAQPALSASLCYVDADAAGANTGATWTDAYTSLQSALAAAGCTEIWVAAGTYKPSATASRTDTFQIKNGVAIYGGFAGTEAARDQRNWTTNVVTLSGDLSGNDGPNFANNGENSYTVVEGATGATLDGVTISGGNANGSWPNNWGGGMLNTNSSPTLNNVTFSGNWADSDGGGMYNYGNSNPTLTNVTFSGNSAGGGGWGGGMGGGGSPTLTYVTFSGNTAYQGGGMDNELGSPTLTHVTFSGNTATFGGGMHTNEASATLTDVTFINNSAPLISGVYGKGAGMFMVYDKGTKLTNVIFSGNSAANMGGAMEIESFSTPTLINVTFSGNSAPYGVGGMNILAQSTVKVQNSIFWGNSGGEIYSDSGSTTLVTYSDVQGGYSGTGNINLDPLFRNAAAGDLHLQYGSPAIDTGTNTDCPATDLDGDPRPVDGNFDSTATCDMGAYEYQPRLYAAPSSVGAGDCYTWVSACTLQTALTTAQSGIDIWVQAGAHKPTSGADRAATFQLKSGVAIYGGFAGTEDALDERNPSVNVATLSGDIGIVGNTSDNSYHVVTGATGATLDGVTISGGNANGTNPYDSGGGMYNKNNSPTIINVIFTNNYGFNGGGMFNHTSSPALTNVTFNGNSATNGGGMFNYNSSPLLSQVRFIGNSASSNGGGVENGDSSPSLTNVLFSGNSSGNDGGGMDIGGSSTPSLTNVTFSGNSASHYGPGIRNTGSGASPTLKNVILWDRNITSGFPEIANASGGSATVTYSDVQVSGAGVYPGTGNINQNPLFVDADGPDNVFGTIDDNPRLGFGSPAIEVGTNSGCSSTDLDGLPRPNDGNADSTATCDMGVYEAGEMMCSVIQGSTYTFASQSGVSIRVTTLGTKLACLYVDEMEIDHSNATGVSGGDGLKTGRYWLIRGLQSDKSADASDFSVTLTLPTSFIPDSNDGVCRYTGSGLVWDCALTSFDNVAKTVTRAGVGGLSDWAAGKYVGPTAVELSGLKAYSSVSRLYIHVVFAGLALMAGIGFILICRKRPTSG